MITILLPSENPTRKGGSPVYIVEGKSLTTLQCDCPDYRYRQAAKGGQCKHMKLALEMACLGLGDGSSFAAAPERDICDAKLDLLFGSEIDFQEMS